MLASLGMEVYGLREHDYVKVLPKLSGTLQAHVVQMGSPHVPKVPASSQGDKKLTFTAIVESSNLGGVVVGAPVQMPIKPP